MKIPFIIRFLNGLIIDLNRRIFPNSSVHTAVSLVSRKQMYKLNRKYRGKSRSTDILAFPATNSYAELEELLSGRRSSISSSSKPKPKTKLLIDLAESFESDEILLGHLVFCPQSILGRRTKEINNNNIDSANVSVGNRIHFKKLFCHGYAHLFHFDHHKKSDFLEMRKFEGFLLKKG